MPATRLLGGDQQIRGQGTLVPRVGSARSPLAWEFGSETGRSKGRPEKRVQSFSERWRKAGGCNLGEWLVQPERGSVALSSLELARPTRGY